MTFDPTPWFIGGGAHHSPAVARLLAYAATGGQEGVVSPGDLKVSTLSPAGGGVTIAAGAAAIVNRSPGGDQQAYVMRAPSPTELEVAATGAAARSDLIVVRVEDPEFSPWAVPDDPVEAQYVFPRVIQGVPDDTLSASELNLGYSAIALARIDIPAGTNIVDPGMIVDLRRLAQPSTERKLFTAQPTLATLTSSTFVDFPVYKPQLVVPPWATHATVLASISSLGVVGGDTTGAFRVQLGALISADQAFNFEATGGDYRTTADVVVSGSVVAMQGRLQTLVLQGRKQTGPGSLKALAGTRVVYDVQFEQRTA